MLFVQLFLKSSIIREKLSNALSIFMGLLNVAVSFSSISIVVCKGLRYGHVSFMGSHFKCEQTYV